MPQEHYDVIVVGGGASGMMAAATAAARGRNVVLLEKNAALGEKLNITGGGRCNITNAQFDHYSLLPEYGDAEKFLYSPFSQFDVQDTFDFFESRGLPLKVEERNRAFPKSQRAADVSAVLITELKKTEVTVRTRSRVQRIVHEKNDNGEDVVVGVHANNTLYTAESIILATGGMSHPETGSTGDGFAWLKDLGFSVINPTPTIVPLATADAWVHALAGSTLENIQVTFFADGAKQFRVRGNVLCAHFGISGPTILNSAGKVADLLNHHEVTAMIDLFPTMDEGTLSTHLLALFEEHKNREIKNMLKTLFRTQLVVEVLRRAQISEQTPVHSIKREERKRLIAVCKALPVHITGLMGFDRAVVADGGVSLADIDMREMRSKKHHNIFVTGDLLHIRRPSGGFSLQLCWTTGFVAGSHA